MADSLWQSFFSDPLLHIGYFFSFVSAFAMLIFLRGFLSGVSYVFTMNWHDEHMEHYRTRAIWGVMSLIFIFILWEIVRAFTLWIQSFVG